MRFLTVTSPDVNNGTGFRVTLWVAGCSHHCRGCHNPETWSYNQGKKYSEIKKELYEKLESSYISGLTLSGGDPLSQSNKNLMHLYFILKRIKKDFPDKNIWIFAGDTYEEAIQNKFKKKILSLCDVMVDGPYKCNLRDTSLAFRGSSNQRIIDLHQK